MEVCCIFVDTVFKETLLPEKLCMLIRLLTAGEVHGAASCAVGEYISIYSSERRRIQMIRGDSFLSLVRR